MSRKDYIAIAEIIKRNHQGPFTEKDELCQFPPTGYQRGGADTAECIAKNLATLFARENDRFDRDRFLTACGVQL